MSGNSWIDVYRQANIPLSVEPEEPNNTRQYASSLDEIDGDSYAQKEPATDEEIDAAFSEWAENPFRIFFRGEPPRDYDRL